MNPNRFSFARPALAGLALLLAMVAGAPVRGQDAAPLETSPATSEFPAVEAPAVDSQVETAEPGAEIVRPTRPVRKGGSPSQHGERVVVFSSNRVEAGETAQVVVTIIGNTLVEGTVRDEAVTIMGNARIDGKVGGDVVVVLGSLDVGPNAVIGGEVVVVGGVAKIHPDAVIARGPTVIGMRGVRLQWLTDWFASGLLLGRPFPHDLPWAWAVAGAMILFYLLIQLLFPGPSNACASAFRRRPAMALLAGLLVFLAIGPVFFVLMVSVVGIIVAPFLVAAFFLSVFVGKIAVYRWTGEQVGLKHPVAALLLGSVVFFALYMVPILGMAIWSLATLAGVGSVTLALIEGMRREGRSAPRSPIAPTPPAVVAAAVPASPVAPLAPEAPTHEAGEPVAPVEPQLPPPAAVSYPPSPVEAASYERVGFLPRFGASLLDLILIGILLNLLNLNFGDRLGLVLTIAYFVGFWGWRGTTVGGIILSLRVVRIDARPLDNTVALVRSLSSLLSLAIIGLGFFWASWDREKQSWHDKIAGTTVVKVPRGTPLI
jgi:uncharacterized RDD family membrane protein YckC